MRNIKRLAVYAAVLAIAVAIAVPGLAEAATKKKFKQYTNIVDAAFVKKVVDGQVKGLVVDARPIKKKFNKAHILCLFS